MTAVDASRTATRIRRGVWTLTAALLLIASAALQTIASLERWVWARDSWTRNDISIEDHLFDYVWIADPWEPLGSSALFFGAAQLLLAAAVLALGRSASRGVFTVVLAAVSAAWFVFVGLHSVASGILGSPSPLQHVPLVTVAGFVVIVTIAMLAVRWFALRSVAEGLAATLLIGSTPFGYLVATFVIAPELAGYQSHDTTPWTETIVAATVGLAGGVLVVAAAVRSIRTRRASRIPEGDPASP